MNLIVIISVSIIIGIILGFTIGYVYGYAAAIKWSVHIGKQFVDIDVDEDRISEILIKYKRHVDMEFGHYG